MTVWVKLWVGLWGTIPSNLLKRLAGTTGLEPAASAVTGQRSNQLNYVPSLLPIGLRKPLGLQHFPALGLFLVSLSARPRLEQLSLLGELNCNRGFSACGSNARQNARFTSLPAHLRPS
jgi:hypothetical protein